jgi:large subunit ribosomal protein L18
MLKKDLGRVRRHIRIRKKIVGTNERPRLVVHRSHKNLMAQIIDDLTGKVILGVSTVSKECRSKINSGGNVKAADSFGEIVGQKAKEKGVTRVVFDRGGYLYHGRIKAFADAVRKQGIEL